MADTAINKSNSEQFTSLYLTIYVNKILKTGLCDVNIVLHHLYDEEFTYIWIYKAYLKYIYIYIHTHMNEYIYNNTPKIVRHSD